MFRPEYPRPSFVRDNWLNLNGKWEFEIGNTNIFDKVIEVPFCPESRLSGIEHKDFMYDLQYRRLINITAEQLAGSVIINFGAVDYECTLYVNGKNAGHHKGGYISFAFDITQHLTEGENELILSVKDDTKHPAIPMGKQSDRFESYGCSYTRTTGVWQTVWLDFTGKTYITERKITANPDTKSVIFEGKLNNSDDCEVCAEIFYKNEKIAECKTSANGNFNMTAVLDCDVKLWDVLRPEIYDIVLTVKQNGEVSDCAKTYTGFRSIELKDGKFLLNGKSVFLRQILDQGFHPDGVYTFPTIEDIEKDIDIAIDLGFNGARPHEKIFEEYYFYYADMKGYLVWGEYPNWGCLLDSKINPVGLLNFISEWKEELVRDYNHPSIIGWCPLNETWEGKHFCDAVSQKAIYDVTKEYDSTRPVIGASGGYLYVTDIDDYHDYSHTAEEIISHVHNHKNGTYEHSEVYSKNKDENACLLTPEDLQGLPIFCSEYGGISFNVGDGAWGYVNESNEDDFVAHYISDTTAIMQSDCMGMCYTQLTDVEQEQNGLVTYAREHKFSEEARKKIRECNMQKAKIEE